MPRHRTAPWRAKDKRSASAYALVDTTFPAQTQIDVTTGVHRHTMGVADRPAGEHRPCAIANAGKCRLTVGFLLNDVKDAVPVPGNIVRPAHARPHADESAVAGKNLHAPVAAVADVELFIGSDHKTVRQVKLAGPGLARLAPRLDELSLARKPVHPAVAVAVRNVEIAGGTRAPSRSGS